MIKLGNTLRLETELTESQMDKVIKEVSNFLYFNKDSLNDTTFDYYFPIKRNNKEVELNIVVEFSDSLDQIDIKEGEQYFNKLIAEIMDDYMVLKCDTMVFQQRLQFLLNDINKQNAAYTKEDEEDYRCNILLSHAG